MSKRSDYKSRHDRKCSAHDLKNRDLLIFGVPTNFSMRDKKPSIMSNDSFDRKLPKDKVLNLNTETVPNT